MTEKALKKYQEKYGISSSTATTSYFGPKSRKFYEEHCKKEDVKENKNKHDNKDDDNEDENDD
jgi:hypothetical protein